MVREQWCLLIDLGTNDRWADTNMESPHRLSVPTAGNTPLSVVPGFHSNPTNRHRSATTDVLGIHPCPSFRVSTRTRQTGIGVCATTDVLSAATWPSRIK